MCLTVHQFHSWTSHVIGVQVTLPDEGASFALMYSYEQRSSVAGEKGRVGVQVMGPNDGYIAQTATDLSMFWADRNDLALGTCLKPAASRTQGKVPQRPLPAVCLALFSAFGCVLHMPGLSIGICCRQCSKTPLLRDSRPLLPGIRVPSVMLRAHALAPYLRQCRAQNGHSM